MNEMKPKEALKFIKDCKKLGVTSGKFGNLEFELTPGVPRAPRPALKASKKQIAATEATSLAQSNFDQAKEQLSMMHVEDPVGFEQALIENELSEGSGEFSGSEEALTI